MDARVRLEKVSARAGFECLRNQSFVVMHGEHEDLRLRVPGLDLAGHLDAVDDRQAVVDDRDVGFGLIGQLDGLLAIPGLADNDPLRTRFQHRPQPGTDHVVIVGYEDPQHSSPNVAVMPPASEVPSFEADRRIAFLLFTSADPGRTRAGFDANP